MAEYEFVDRPESADNPVAKWTLLWESLLLTVDNGQAVNIGPVNVSWSAYQAMVGRVRGGRMRNDGAQMFTLHCRTVNGCRLLWLTRSEEK